MSRVVTRGGNYYSQRIVSFFKFSFLESTVAIVNRPPIAVIILIIATTGAFISAFLIDDIEFEYNMTNLWAKGIKSAITQDSIISKFEISPDYAVVLAENLEEARDIISKVKKVSDRYDIIGKVDGITSFIKSDSIQDENIALLQYFRVTLNRLTIDNEFNDSKKDFLYKELLRLQQNLIEIADLSVLTNGEKSKVVKQVDRIIGKREEDGGYSGSKILNVANDLYKTDNSIIMNYSRIFGNYLKYSLLRLSNSSRIDEAMLPKAISSRYINSKGENLITIYPKGNIWDENRVRKFNSAMTNRVSSRVTGLPVLMQKYIDIMKSKGAIAVIFGTIAVFLFLLFDFRSFYDTILAIIPLIIGTLWMVGFMYLFNIKFNIINFMALPLIIGIGIDDGVHILHRYNLEGGSSVSSVIRYTGRAILLTSLTTSIGFASMAMVSHRGVASMGLLLVIGVVSCFITSTFVLTALISLRSSFQRVPKLTIQKRDGTVV
jgi:predicted RND superfamily exporter protein